MQNACSRVVGEGKPEMSKIGKIVVENCLYLLALGTFGDEVEILEIFSKNRGKFTKIVDCLQNSQEFS